VVIGGVVLTRGQAGSTKGAPNETAGIAVAAAPIPAPAPPPRSAGPDPMAASSRAAPAEATAPAVPVGASRKSRGRRSASRQVAAAPATSPAAALAGVWAGPWIDREKHQHGRLYLQVLAGGQVSGWMSNLTAHQTFRLAGRVSPSGQFDLACECAPAQAFAVRGALRPGATEARGQLAFSSSAGVFGRGQVTLGRQASR
jgi:hypothetical protein